MADLSLKDALRYGNLEEFIRQAEADGIGPIDEAAFLGAASKVIKHEPQSDRTSRSASSGGSTGK